LSSMVGSSPIELVFINFYFFHGLVLCVSNYLDL
jgi:hypothetical protein